MTVTRSDVAINRKFLEMIKLLNIYLNHFPKHEKFALAKFKKAVKRGDFNPVISLIGHAQHSATIVFYSHFLHKNNLLSNLPPRSKALCLSIINTHPLRTSTQH